MNFKEVFPILQSWTRLVQMETRNQKYDGCLKVEENGEVTFSRSKKSLFALDWSKAVFEEPKDSTNEQFERVFVVFPPKEDDYIIRKHRF